MAFNKRASPTSPKSLKSPLPVKIENVAILGASGKLGRHIVDALVRQKDLSVTAIVRKSSTATYDRSVRVVRVSDNYEKREMMSAFRGQHAVIVTLAYEANFYHHRNIMDAAAESGVKHFVPNHWGSNAELLSVRQNSARAGALDNDVDYLRTKEASGMNWTAIIPGIFFDMAFPYGLLGFNLKDRSVEIWDSGNASFSASTNDDIANATVAVLRNQLAAKNKYVYTSSFETTQNQILASVEGLTGSKWKVKPVKTVDKVKEAKDKLAAGAQGRDWLMAQGTLAASTLFSGEEHQSDFYKYGRSSNKDLLLSQGDMNEALKPFLKQ